MWTFLVCTALFFSSVQSFPQSHLNSSLPAIIPKTLNLLRPKAVWPVQRDFLNDTLVERDLLNGSRRGGVFSGSAQGNTDHRSPADHPDGPCCRNESLSPFITAYRNSGISVAEKAVNGTVWIFSYGSNMMPEKFKPFNVQPIASIPGVLKGYTLKFDTTLGTAEEPSFANIRKSDDPSACVHGVLSLLTESDLSKFDVSEPSYWREIVSVMAYSGEMVSASAYMCTGKDWETRPSYRYSKLVYCGAVQAGLCSGYVRTLRQFLLNETQSNICDDGIFEVLPPGYFSTKQ